MIGKGKGFTRKMTEGAMKGIIISLDSGIPIARQYKKFSESAETYVGKEKMSNVAICIKELEDKPDDFFESKKADTSNCAKCINVW